MRAESRIGFWRSMGVIGKRKRTEMSQIPQCGDIFRRTSNNPRIIDRPDSWESADDLGRNRLASMLLEIKGVRNLFCFSVAARGDAALILDRICVRYVSTTARCRKGCRVGHSGGSPAVRLPFVAG